MLWITTPGSSRVWSQASTKRSNCQDLGRIKIHPCWIGWAHHQTCYRGLIADRASPSCSFSSLAHSVAWMHPQRMSPPFLSPLDLPQLAPLPPQFPSVLCVSLPRNHLSSSSPSPHSVLCQIHGARFLTLFCESCEGNLEGLSGINLKRKRLSLLLSLALLADWVRSPGTCRLLISTTPLSHRPPTTPAQSFFWAWLQKKKICSTFWEMWAPTPFFAPVRGRVKVVNPLGGTNNLMVWLTLSLKMWDRAVSSGGGTLKRTCCPRAACLNNWWEVAARLMHNSHSVGNGCLCYKEEKGTRWCLGALPCWAVLKVLPPLYDMKEQWPCSKRDDIRLQ